MSDLHESHTCKDCGAVITLPYARTADPGGLREAWLAGWAAYKDDESWAFNQSPEQVAGHADAYVHALTPEATAPDGDQ